MSYILFTHGFVNLSHPEKEMYGYGLKSIFLYDPILISVGKICFDVEIIKSGIIL